VGVRFAALFEGEIQTDHPAEAEQVHVDLPGVTRTNSPESGALLGPPNAKHHPEHDITSCPREESNLRHTV
jgi:hypothetical protein